VDGISKRFINKADPTVVLRTSYWKIAFGEAYFCSLGNYRDIAKCNAQLRNVYDKKRERNIGFYTENLDFYVDSYDVRP
jgi:hypothetical protein